MKLRHQNYEDQQQEWPAQGRHILAHYDDSTIIVYQAYRPAIGNHAIMHGVFGGEFSYSRMSWIKPNFLWMMYRSGWGTKEGQETTLALRLSRVFFDSLLMDAVASSFSQSGCATEEDWKHAVAASNVRLQWDPDHDPRGNALARRAIQLGLRGNVLQAFGTTELIEVIDMTEFAAAQRARLSEAPATLQMPVERVYLPADPAIRRHLRLEAGPD